ncbi:MAG: prolipoprotein diacylglyceryl transferase, partial [Alistipes sp.]|nr:prolipoprotein diacylglyceryl transferase [Alistipes sp.]
MVFTIEANILVSSRQSEKMLLYCASFIMAKKSYLRVLDRTVIAVAITGCCIRFGNLMNHEIY